MILVMGNRGTEKDMPSNASIPEMLRQRRLISIPNLHARGLSPHQRRGQRYSKYMPKFPYTFHLAAFCHHSSAGRARPLLVIKLALLLRRVGVEIINVATEVGELVSMDKTTAPAIAVLATRTDIAVLGFGHVTGRMSGIERM
jgi:hypothetical protein